MQQQRQTALAGATQEKKEDNPSNVVQPQKPEQGLAIQWLNRPNKRARPWDSNLTEESEEERVPVNRPKRGSV